MNKPSVVPQRFSNRILILTFIAILLIAIISTVMSYKSQVRISEEKELFKLDCIANAVAYKISGEEHDYLVATYPDSTMRSKAELDSVYMKIKELMSGAQQMTKVPSEMYTVLNDPNHAKLFFGIGTMRNEWLSTMDVFPAELKNDFEKGGMVRSYEVGGWDKLSAFSPIRDANNNVVSVLQVEETRDSFMGKAREQIMMSVFLSLAFIAVIGILMYFSVRNLLKRQERIALEKMEVEMLRSELVSNVSHDLRTPLASIHGYLETVLMKQDTLSKEEVSKYLNTSLQSTERLRVMVDELFDLSKLESKERKLNLEKLSLGELLSDVTNQFRVNAAEKNVSLLSEIPKDLPPVKGDVALLDRVIQNILGNAIKFCNSGDQILVRAGTENEKVWVEIKDSGIGIHEDDLPHIFDRFHKGKTERSGSGIGLAIVKSVLELHEASYTVKSKASEGTIFKFSLPIHKKD
ncbi:MAG: HAMP domain-containing sensor histidine kinase [Flavobacteriales bacterium]|nr:HAMP domain-containing sensor histidine kinase [Flavobacteriales bacterium]